MARVISRAKWERKEWMSEREISADAVTADLRTQDNILSFWQCGEGTDKEVNNVALAIAAGRDNIDKVEIVLIDDKDLENDGQIIKASNGRTPVGSMVKLHVDVIRLDYYRLGKVAHLVASAVAADKFHRITKKSVKTLLVTAITESEVLQVEGLNDKLRPRVQRLLS
ncbi:MAG: hypothetical protein F4058_03845 [Rhodothermaceae bacterium]|nr:hypothetical protein [Rhodothermaceae bacterium]